MESFRGQQVQQSPRQRPHIHSLQESSRLTKRQNTEFRAHKAQFRAQESGLTKRSSEHEVERPVEAALPVHVLSVAAFEHHVHGALVVALHLLT